MYDPGTRERLAGLKDRYDPANLFRRNCGPLALRVRENYGFRESYGISVR
ncbi:BBE domain-containing protein [Streptomyces bullii]|uniref:BBE domain-containing protein n=1 Tax=Streptomyces bullii TaxID=349910 RepID=A0ABW0UGC0_9ACTN